MVSGVSSINTPIASMTMMHAQQIQTLEAQAGSLEARIYALEERIMAIHDNGRLSNEERAQQINPINEQIGRIRERISEVRVRISETRARHREAENDARRRQQANEDRARQNRAESGETDEVVDGALVHAIIRADQNQGDTGQVRAELSSRQRTAGQENIWRINEDPDDPGRMVLIPIEDRRPRSPEEAHSAQTRMDTVDQGLIRDSVDRAAALERQAETRPEQDEDAREDDDTGHSYTRPGTGRREAGQFLEGRA
ncbi:MAG: hypothetical protein FWE32_00200 [Oscillospiraceae bacterium]|nr:hypothetical protein [Oscillospiraceae bacterium]